MHKHPLYYAVRNHIIDFLVARSRSFAKEMRATYDPRAVPVVRPSAEAAIVPPTSDANVVRLAGHGH